MQDGVCLEKGSLVHHLTRKHSQPELGCQHLGAALCPPAAHMPCSPASRATLRRVAARTRSAVETLCSEEGGAARHPASAWAVGGAGEGRGGVQQLPGARHGGPSARELVTSHHSHRPQEQAARGGHSHVGRPPAPAASWGPYMWWRRVVSAWPRSGQALSPSALSIWDLLACCAGGAGPDEPLLGSPDTQSHCPLLRAP